MRGGSSHPEHVRRLRAGVQRASAHHGSQPCRAGPRRAHRRDTRAKEKMRSLPRPIAALVAEPESTRKLGQFRLVEQLGRGGFAPVWSASEEYAGRELRTVALKLFSLEPGDSGQAGSVEQVLEEARTLCRVE